MLKFLIVLEETDGPQNDFTGRQVSKMFEHPTLPDLNHQVVIDGNGYPVKEIEHRLYGDSDDDECTIRVFVPWWKNDFEPLWADSTWKKEGFG